VKAIRRSDRVGVMLGRGRDDCDPSDTEIERAEMWPAFLWRRSGYGSKYVQYFIYFLDGKSG